MKDTDQIIAIAEACGWRKQWLLGKAKPMPNTEDSLVWFPPLGGWTGEESLPNYLTSLDAMHEAEQVIMQQGLSIMQNYVDNLRVVIFGEAAEVDGSYEEMASVIHATAAQRAEAFLRTIGKWKD